MADPTSSVFGTSFNETIVAILIPAVAWANQKYGLSLPVDPDTLTVLVTALTGLIVYFIPNRVTSTQAAAVVAATKDDPIVNAKANAIVAADKAGA